MQINHLTLQNDGFIGFQSFEQLEIKQIPQVPGIYAVLKPEGFERLFLATSVGGHFKKQDPSVLQPALEKEWIEDADVLYIGKAGREAPATGDSESAFKSSLTSAAASPLAIGAGGFFGSSPDLRH